jgi:hypothetical protein
MGKQTYNEFGRDLNLISGSKEFNGARPKGFGIEFISKNPSTAAGSYMPGGGYGPSAMNNGNDFDYGQNNESFDLDINMPPDIGSLDSDLSKLSFFII